MTELNFSAMGDTNEEIEELIRLLKEFDDAHHTKTSVRRLSWKSAWQRLLTVAIEGKGEDVSQVGSTWAPTLAALDSLRPFSEAEVRSLGGPLIFVPAAWQTVQIEGRGEVWAVPWSVYTFVIFYRRDLLQRAGVEEGAGFTTPEAMHETFAALQHSGISPWAIPSRQSYLDLPHITSSWIRAYGGDFFAPDGKNLEFNAADARRGLVDFFGLYRFMPAQLQGLDYDTCLGEFFHKGETAMVIAGPEAYSEALEENTLSEALRDLIGVSALPGVSWIGGDHLVLWKTVRLEQQKEKSAVDLIRSLISVENQIRLFQEARILPARLDAYVNLEFQPEGMRAVLEKILQTARPHPPARLWRRTESMLVDMLCEIADKVMDSPRSDVAAMVEQKTAEYERRFSLFLK
jgi:multiple sugar transport system substrate-binding protein